MSIRAKTKKRLIILVTVTLLVIIAGVGFVVIRKQQTIARIQGYRAEGMAAYEAGDYLLAQRKLGGYLKKYKNDVEAMYAFAASIQKYPQDRDAHVFAAINPLRQVLALEPDHEKASLDLLGIYSLLRNDVEAMSLADRILARDPDHADAMRVKVAALSRRGRQNEAVEYLKKLVAADEMDVSSQMKLYQIQWSQGTEPMVLVERAREVSSRHPDDSRAELLLAFAHRLNGEGDKAGELLKKAASHANADKTFIIMLVRHLDSMGLYQQSLEALQTQLEDNQPFRDEMIRRLWENGMHEQVLAHTAKLTWPPALEQEIDLWGIRAMSLYQLQSKDEADQLTAKLASLQQRPLAVVWAGLLKQLAKEDPDLQEVLLACREAIDVSGDHAYFNFYLGQVYTEMSEHDLALKAWQFCIDERPTWVLPLRMRLQSLIALGQYEQAMDEVQKSVQSDLGSVNVSRGLDLVLAQSAAMDWSDRQALDQMLVKVAYIHQEIEGEPRTLGLYVRLLAALDRQDEAAAVLKKAMDSEQRYTLENLIELARISRDAIPGIEQLCLQRCERDYGQTAAALSVRAETMLIKGDAAGALAMTEQAYEQHRGSEEELSWRMIWVNMLERTGDDRADEQLKALAQAYPNTVSVQRLVLESQSLAGDRAFVDRTIDRLHDLTGDGAMTWRLARVKWLIEDGSEQSLAQAVSMLEGITRQSPGMFEARVMLGRCFAMMGSRKNAIESMLTALDIKPQRLDVRISLAQLYQQERNYPAAREQLDYVLRSSQATSDEMKAVAELLANQGEQKLATEILEQVMDEDQAGGGELLGRMYLRQGRIDRVREICDRLLAEPTFGGLMFALEFYAQSGDDEKVSQAKAGIKALNLEPGVYELAMAEHAARFESMQLATAYFRQAIEAAPQHIGAKQALIVHLINLGQTQDVLAVIHEARAAHPQELLFEYLALHESLIETAMKSELLRSIVMSMLRDPDQRNTAVEVLQLLTSNGSTMSEDQRLTRLHQLANNHAEYLALQNLATEYLMLSGRSQEAMELSAAAMDNFPSAARPAQLAVYSARAAGRWDQVLVAGRKWRARTSGQWVMADVAIAEAMVQLGDSRGAISVLEPYVESYQTGEEVVPVVLLTYARGLLKEGRIDEARSLIEPRLSQDSQWRSQWMNMASREIRNTATAVDWLNRVQGYLSNEDVSEWLKLSQSWSSLYQRSGNGTYHQKARDLVARAVELDDKSPAAWSFYGLLAEVDKDYEKAETGYRKALEYDSRLHVIKNNLAMVLIYRKGDLDEAVRLANEALADVPGSADYLDTLGQVHAARGEYDKAVEYLEKALEYKPGDLQFTQRLEGYKAKAESNG